MAEERRTEVQATDVHPPRPRTGWENVKEAYVFSRIDGEISQEAFELIAMFLMGMAAGSIYGGVPASRHARNRFIKTSDAALYPSRLDAVGTSYNAGTRGFIRYGFRWGWRTGFLVLGFHGISSFLAVYRDKTDMLNYTAAAVTTGGLYRFNMGIKGIIGGSFIGALLGVPAGCLMVGLQKLNGETFHQKKKRERMEEKLEREQEQMQKEKFFGDLIENVNKSVKKDGDPHR